MNKILLLVALILFCVNTLHFQSLPSQIVGGNGTFPTNNNNGVRIVGGNGTYPGGYNPNVQPIGGNGTYPIPYPPGSNTGAGSVIVAPYTKPFTIVCTYAGSSTVYRQDTCYDKTSCDRLSADYLLNCRGSIKKYFKWSKLYDHSSNHLK